MTLSVLYVAVALCVMARAAPPASPRFYQHPSQLQQINPVDYYLDNPDAVNYYNQPQQKQGNINTASNGAPARLETLEPDSEVELIPGTQQPQQPPQQTPVSPNIPGLLPGQRVFIVHMPVPGYRPGTIGGYQPVYIVAAAPQGNSYGANGFQNTVLLDPSGQVVSPLGYSGISGVSHANPGLLLGAPPAPPAYNRPFNVVYQDPAPYQAPGGEAPHGAVRLAQTAILQGPVASFRPQSEAVTSPDSKRPGQEFENLETKENLEEPRRNARPAPSHTQIRNKA
ncbi:unnamed protein product [Parnassius apollo]|uniref:(apollo) hypothetical protein n=1 Tax=Parnassius apollo TaxID=110799 RepID=A0A8S3Y1Q6_PARAO|nr:unnamed protein product [Parnassius apollo]